MPVIDAGSTEPLAPALGGEDDPPPHATPIDAFTHTVAAVVRPWTPLRVRMIAPAPRNPIPVTICAVMRVGSLAAVASSSDMIVKSAEPMPIRMFVRNPALF